MVFVNCIASIVHYATNPYAGAANKNIGDAFLLVWRLTEQDTNVGVASGVAESRMAVEAFLEQQLMDNALYAFLKVIVDIENSNRNGALRRYRKLPEMLDRFGGRFRVQMGFGLHFGWAIEGKCTCQRVLA